MTSFSNFLSHLMLAILQECEWLIDMFLKRAFQLVGTGYGTRPGFDMHFLGQQKRTPFWRSISIYHLQMLLGSFLNLINFCNYVVVFSYIPIILEHWQFVFKILSFTLIAERRFKAIISLIGLLVFLQNLLCLFFSNFFLC